MMDNKRVGAERDAAVVEARAAIAGLAQLLLGQVHGELIECERVGALVRLVQQRVDVALGDA